jgi:hypothetical protein
MGARYNKGRSPLGSRLQKSGPVWKRFEPALPSMRRRMSRRWPPAPPDEPWLVLRQARLHERPSFLSAILALTLGFPCNSRCPSYRRADRAMNGHGLSRAWALRSFKGLAISQARPLITLQFQALVGPAGSPDPFAAGEDRTSRGQGVLADYWI